MLQQKFQIEIPKRGIACKERGEPFVPGMGYYSLLINDPEEGFSRHDFCLECWQKKSIDEQQGRDRVFWHSVIPSSKEVYKDCCSERDQQIHQLFHGTSQSEWQGPAERFILALYLQRKKKLILRREWKDEEGRTFLLYEIPESEEMLPIEKVPLSTIDIQNIQANIAEKLKRSSSG